jgi:hypothetical protein
LPALNYTLSDIFGALIAFGLFPLVIVFPGYTVGWLLDLFNFRNRTRIVQFLIGLVLSITISPILFYLSSSLISTWFSFALIVVFLLSSIAILIRNRKSNSGINRFTKIAVWIGVFWVALAIFSLVDFQWGNRLYFSVVSYDQTTRVSIIDAITRTGVPPINPSYHPNGPVYLTFLYYFWYILCSLVDQLGGNIVSARTALIASNAWCGLGLMATIALYLRLRNPDHSEKIWRSAILGIGSLAVSGLDIIPLSLMMIATRQIFLDVEHWNAQVTAWVGSFLWVPHHVAGLIACLTAVMLIYSVRGQSLRRAYIAMTVAGMAFASALGLSVWVTLVFVVFWGGWIVSIFIENKERDRIIPMIYAGIVALILAFPFLAGMTGGGSGSSQFPIALEVRTFYLFEPLISAWPPIAHALASLIILPVNYLFELGFFLIVGILWFQIRVKDAPHLTSFHTAEILLLVIVFILGSFLRSTLIENNDLGWRAWLPGQFILLIWGVDVLEILVFSAAPLSKTNRASGKGRNLLITLAAIGIMTSVLDVVCLRIAWPVKAGEDMAKRMYSARLAYDYLRDQVPADSITQNNALDELDRPAGLYGTHQMVIADRTAFGVPLPVFQDIVNKIGVIFTSQNESNWQGMDSLCREYSIDILIFKDTDPVWDSLPTLESFRPPIYKNNNYELFACGNYAEQ